MTTNNVGRPKRGGEYAVKKARHIDSVHRGISFGTILMIALTITVVGLYAAIMPRLLGKTDFRIHVGGMLSALSLDESLTVLTLNEIPLGEATPTPAPSN